jgi:hypothetical protein
MKSFVHSPNTAFVISPCWNGIARDGAARANQKHWPMDNNVFKLV